MVSAISHLTARQILDSRGSPTIETTCHLTDGRTTHGSCPSGASTGTHEAVELRDHNPHCYSGLSVHQAVDHVTRLISPLVAGLDPTQQPFLDKSIIDADHSPNKQNFGANAILSSSIALARAGALVKNVPLYRHLADLANNDQVLTIPIPFFNILNGGLHGGMNLDFQEFIVVPNPAYFPRFSQQLEAGSQLNQSLKKTLSHHHFSTSVGDEGGFAPRLRSNQAAIKLIQEAGQAINLDFPQNFHLSFDFAANSYYQKGFFHLKDIHHPLNPDEYIKFIISLVDTFKPLSIEDPIPEDDWDHWHQLYQTLGSKTKLVGDDLLVTNLERLKQAHTKKVCNAILIKPNQVGTVTETIEVVNYAKAHHFTTIASHRSGETIDDFIADFAVGLGTDYVKFGAPVRGERIAKYNRLLAIEAELN